MKPAFKLYRRKKIYYCEDIESGQQESLRTSNKDDAVRQLHAKNEAAKMGSANLQIARAYMGAADPHMPLRTWQEVIATVIDSKKGPNQTRWKNAEKDKALAPIISEHRLVLDLYRDSEACVRKLESGEVPVPTCESEVRPARLPKSEVHEPTGSFAAQLCDVDQPPL